MTRISEARTCRIEIPSDRSNIEGGDRSLDRRIDDARLYARRRLEGARGRQGFCNGKLPHEKVVKRGRTAWQRGDEGGDTDLNIDVEEQRGITKRGPRCMAAPYDLSCPALYRVPLFARCPHRLPSRGDLMQPHVLS